MPITYIKGDATEPQASGPKIVAHICNDLGRWGKGFVLAVSKRWPEAKECYLAWHRTGEDPCSASALNTFALGRVQFVVTTSPKNITVANMIGQRGIYTGSNGPPIRYDAVEQCLGKVGEMALRLEASIHMPRIGCGLAGGTWEKIGPIVESALKGFEVTVYDYE